LNKKTAFVVLSCDSYSDLWPMYTHFFEKNWMDCPYDKYFVSNSKSVEDCSFNSILIGEDKSWSDGLLKALTIIKKDYEYVFITLEDWPIIAKVDQNYLNVMLYDFFRVDGNYLTFRCQPESTHKYNNYFGIIEKGSLYRPACVYAIWKISVLEDLLVLEENAWEFEKFGSVRSDKYDKFYVVYNSFFKICNTVVKGKWVRSEYNRIISLGFFPDIKSRKLSSIKDECYLKIYVFIFNLFMRLIPWKIQRKIVFKVKGYEGKC
jgi:hypothetical protein